MILRTRVVITNRIPVERDFGVFFSALKNRNESVFNTENTRRSAPTANIIKYYNSTTIYCAYSDFVMRTNNVYQANARMCSNNNITLSILLSAGPSIVRTYFFGVSCAPRPKRFPMIPGTVNLHRALLRVDDVRKHNTLRCCAVLFVYAEFHLFVDRHRHRHGHVFVKIASSRSRNLHKPNIV